MVRHLCVSCLVECRHNSHHMHALRGDQEGLAFGQCTRVRSPWLIATNACSWWDVAVKIMSDDHDLSPNVKTALTDNWWCQAVWNAIGGTSWFPNHMPQSGDSVLKVKIGNDPLLDNWQWPTWIWPSVPRCESKFMIHLPTNHMQSSEIDTLGTTEALL